MRAIRSTLPLESHIASTSRQLDGSLKDVNSSQLRDRNRITTPVNCNYGRYSLLIPQSELRGEELLSSLY